MADVTILCFLASYTVAFALELLRLRKPGRIGLLAGCVFSAAGFLAHTLFLWNKGRAAALPPLLSSSQDWMLVLAWLVIGLYLFLICCDRKLSIGVFLLPLVLVLIGASLLADQRSELPDRDVAARNGWAMLHVSSLVLGSAGVLTGVVLSLMYLLQHGRLRQKSSPAAGLRLPSLERLSRMNWWSVVVSVPLLTVGMGTGLVLLLSGAAAASELSLGDPVVVINGCSWLGLAGLFGWMLLTPRATGKQVAWRTLLACGLLLLTVVGLSVLTSSGRISSGHAGWAIPATSGSLVETGGR